MNKPGFVSFLFVLNTIAFLAAGNIFAISPAAPVSQNKTGKFVDNRKLPLSEMEIIPAPVSGSFYTVKRFQPDQDFQDGSVQVVYRYQFPGSNYLSQNGLYYAKDYLARIYPSHNFW